VGKQDKFKERAWSNKTQKVRRERKNVGGETNGGKEQHRLKTRATRESNIKTPNVPRKKGRGTAKTKFPFARFGQMRTTGGWDPNWNKSGNRREHMRD